MARLELAEGDKEIRLETADGRAAVLRICPRPRGSPESSSLEWRAPSSDYRLNKVRYMDGNFQLWLVVSYDSERDVTLAEADVAGGLPARDLVQFRRPRCSGRLWEGKKPESLVKAEKTQQRVV